MCVCTHTCKYSGMILFTYYQIISFKYLKYITFKLFSMSILTVHTQHTYTYILSYDMPILILLTYCNIAWWQSPINLLLLYFSQPWKPWFAHFYRKTLLDIMYSWLISCKLTSSRFFILSGMIGFHAFYASGRMAIIFIYLPTDGHLVQIPNHTSYNNGETNDSMVILFLHDASVFLCI